MTKKLATYRIEAKEQLLRSWCVTPEDGTTLLDCLQPEFWRDIALGNATFKQLSVWDDIFVRDEAGDWCAELIVRDVGNGWAKVAVKSHTVFDNSPVQVPAGKAGDHAIKFAGPIHKYQVIRLSDKQMLKDGMSKAEANAWLMNYLQTISA